jgi:hypothetical protein
MADIDDFRNQELLAVEEGYSPREQRVQSDSRDPGSDLFWNVLTMLVWLGIAMMVVTFLAIYKNPGSRLNLFPPNRSTLIASIGQPDVASAAALPIEIQADTPTAALTDTATTLPFFATATPELTATEAPTPGPTATPTIQAIYPFILRNDPVAIAGDAMPGHEGCKLGIAGQSYDLQGAPMVGITVMLGGHLDGYTLYQLSLTGTALQFGQAGYEFTVAEQAVESKSGIWVQLFDQALVPLSSRVYLDTAADCQKNLILVNFRQVR